MNRLSKETSPYLLQHAHNPVDWFPWGEEALEKARNEDKPVLVSIGYAACHWCHVMERESFEDEGTARLMNEGFINIKIDREERPDLDHIYMDAVQAMTGSGGWPLNVFLTPDGKPFYGGTYFPPRPLANRPSWKEVLGGIARSFAERRPEIEEQAENLTGHIRQSGSFGVSRSDAAGLKEGTPVFDQALLDTVFRNIMKTADTAAGGFGMAPKFPQTFTIRYLLHYYYFTGDNQALDQACLSLDRMIRGGIYDQIGGGFSRYSTDAIWLVPHFEKMLYDNALLVTTLCEAFQLTGNPLYRETIVETMEFVGRELRSPEGGFYSALDADSEGVEGKYYIWDKSEILAILSGNKTGPGEGVPERGFSEVDAALFCEFYQVSETGNWEGKNILHRLFPVDIFAKNKGMDAGELEKMLAEGRRKLLAYRSLKVRPALDDKILLGWNALMNAACSKAYAALGIAKYRDWAESNMDFLLHNMEGAGIYSFYHSYKAGQAKFPAFLDDYAYLTDALIQLQEITSEPAYLLNAKEIAGFVLENFGDEESIFFYYTHQDQKDVIVRKKEIYDGATPSGNAMMAFNLELLGVFFNEPVWRARGGRMAADMKRVITEYPTSFGVWATFLQALTYLIPEIVITGRNINTERKEFLSNFIPYRVYQSATEENTHFPLLRDKPSGERPLLFLCKDYACQLPVNEVDSLIRLLENVKKFKP